MAGVNRSTYLMPDEDDAVAAIARRHKWSHSKAIAELVRSSPDFKRELAGKGEHRNGRTKRVPSQ